MFQSLLKRYGDSHTVLWAKVQQLVGILGSAGLSLLVFMDGL